MKTLVLTILTVFLLGACGERGHDQGKPGAEAGHGHDHAPGAEKITHFTDRTELFVEFPRLVAGESSAFAAHLTALADFRAVAAGRLSVVLSGGGRPDEVFSVDAPSQPGIFRPVATPKQAGERELAIVVTTADYEVRHELGPVTVHADRRSADAAGGAHEEDGGIVFTKEQQWKVDFATAEAVTRELRPGVAATGQLRARPDGEALLTAPAPGQVQPAGKFPQLGQAVRKGELLAYLAPRLGGEKDLAGLQADAIRARAERDLADRELARMESLFKEEAVAEKRVEAARAAAATARAGHEAAQRRLGQYGNGGSGGGIPLRAPVAGVVVDVRVAPGAFAQEGSLLFHIADRRSLWLELRVPEADAARLTASGAPGGASFRVDGIGESFELVAGKNARLVAVGGAVDAVSRTVPVIFEFDRPDARLRLGVGVRAQVLAGTPRRALAVPASAVLDESGVAVVFVMTGGESFERRPVRVGSRDGDWLEVSEGLEPGQRVVARGAYLVKLAAARTGDIGHGHAH